MALPSPVIAYNFDVINSTLNTGSFGSSNNITLATDTTIDISNQFIGTGCLRIINSTGLTTVNTRVSVPGFFASSTTNGFSFSFWAKMTAFSPTPAKQYLICLGSSDNFNLSLQNNTTVDSYTLMGGASWTGAPNLRDNVYHHYVWTFNQTNSQQTLYIDNVSRGTITLPQNMSNGYYVDKMVIGASANSFAGHLNGFIDGFRVYNINLSATFVSYLYKIGSNTSLATLTSVSSADLIAAGASSQQLSTIGKTITGMIGEGVTVSQLLAGGATVSQLLAGGATVSQLRTGGVTVSQLLAGGATVSQLLAGGVTVSQLRAEGLTVSQLLAGGATVSQLLTGGVTVSELLAGGATVSQLRAANVTVSQLTDLGYTLSQLVLAGYNATELTAAGYNTSQLIAAGLLPNWNIDTSANCFIKSYVNDFVDVSGYIGLRNNANLYVHGNAEFGGNLSLNKPVLEADLSFNNRIFVGGDISMNGKVNIGGNVSLIGSVVNCSNVANNSVPQSAFNGSVPAGPNYAAAKVAYKQKFQVNADVSMNGTTVQANNVKANGNIVFSDGTIMNSYDNNILSTNPTVFKPSTFTSLTINGSLTAGSYSTSSDYRIKTEVAQLDETITVDNLRPVKYVQTLINKTQYGLIAHELQDHYPDLVVGEKDGDGWQRVNYTGLIAILINEIKRMKQDLAELEGGN